MKSKLYETIARHLKGGAWARVGRTRYGLSEQNVYVWRAKGIRLAMKTYTFRSQNVYVSGTKRIRLG